MLIKNENPNICGTGGWRVKVKVFETLLFAADIAHNVASEFINNVGRLNYVCEKCKQSAFLIQIL